MRVKLTRN